MRKIYLTFLWVAAALFVSTSLNAQMADFPWPDLGEAKVIEPGPPGKINDEINFDTTATGERAGNAYILITTKFS
jgi:hypothetical protein